LDQSHQFWIKVRTLGEFVFCPRAGILAAEKEGGEDEPDDDPIRLDFLPEYSLTVIEEQLALHLRALGSWGGRVAGVLIAIAVAWFFGWKVAVVIGAVVLLWLGRRLGQEIRAVLTLADSRRQAIAAEPKEPPENATSQTPVNWWELLKAGFDSIRVQESLRDEASKLAGRPWRVLRKGSLRIPVIKIGEDFYEGGRYWIYAQHEIRLAAYAHLLAACEGGEVPYGIVLFGNTYQGVAIPITAQLKENFLAKRAEFDRAMAAAKKGNPPDEPDAGCCSGCPFGKPEKVNTDLVQIQREKIHGRNGRDGKLYHSECGDRFEWIPPHAQTKKKGMLPPDK
jgi:hypothetical protein